MPQTTRRITLRPPLDATEVRELAECIDLLVATARGAIDRGRFELAEAAITHIGLCAGMLRQMGLPVEVIGARTREEAATTAADVAMRESASAYRRRVDEINGDDEDSLDRLHYELTGHVEVPRS